MRCLWSVGERVGARAKRPLIQILNFDLIRKLARPLADARVPREACRRWILSHGGPARSHNIHWAVGPRPGHLKSPCTPG